MPITQIIQCGPGGVGRWCHDVVGGRGGVGLFPLCLSLISLPLNQASVGLMVWWRSRFDVADHGGAVVVDRWVAIMLLIVDRGGAVVGFL